VKTVVCSDLQQPYFETQFVRNMATKQQKNGDWAEKLVAKMCMCPKCKHPSGKLKQLVQNFECADLICNFCGYLAQVKFKQQPNPDNIPNTITGAAWGPQQVRMQAGIYTPLFFVSADISKSNYAIFYIPVDYQTKAMFVPRPPLQPPARRAGWQGFTINLRDLKAQGIIQKLV
jgi:type II restriction enzyme